MNPPAARRLSIPLLLAILGSVAVLSLGTGPVPIAPDRILALLCEGPSTEVDAVIVWDLRLPRLLLAMLVGAALAQSGAVMQGFFQNPMADPYIIGVSSGAALGVTIAMGSSFGLSVLGGNAVTAGAFAGALVVTFLVYAISLRAGRLPTTILLLSGVAVGSMATALTSFVMITSRTDLHQVLYWLMGSLASRRWEHVHMIWPYVLVGVVALQFFARDLNIILQGEESAKHLGVEVERLKRILLVGAALLAAVAVAVSGIVGFVGLMVPHVMRLMVGPDHRRLFPASIVGGAILLVGADLAARTLIAPAEIPLGVITALVGCPFFLYLLSRRREV